MIAFLDGIRGKGNVYHQGQPGELRTGLIPHVLPNVTVLNWQQYSTWDTAPPDVILVSMFPNSDGVCRNLKARFPKTRIIAWIDPGVDVLLSHYGTDQHNMIRDLAFADAIGTWDPSLKHGQFLSMMTGGKRVIEIPIPLIPGAEHLRQSPKENLIMGVLHCQPPRQPGATLATVQALARATSCDVVIFDDRNANAEAVSAFTGASWRIITTFKEAYHLLPSCRLMVDLYAIHHYGRMATHAANVGTLSISSSWCADVGHVRVDPWSDEGYREAMALWDAKKKQDWHLAEGYTILKLRHSPDRIRKQILSVLED